MRIFAGIDLDSIDDLDLELFNRMAVNFINEVNYRKAELNLTIANTIANAKAKADELEKHQQTLAEIQNFPNFETIKYLTNYLQYKEHEPILNNATLENSSVSPNLAQLMHAALELTNDWQTESYLQQDCDMIDVFLKLTPEERSGASPDNLPVPTEKQNDPDFIKMVERIKERQAQLREWQEVLRSHYRAAMQKNVQLAFHTLDAIDQLHLQSRYSENNKHILALSIVHLIEVFYFLLTHGAGHSSLERLFVGVINSLDKAIMALKESPQDAMVEQPDCCPLFTRYKNRLHDDQSGPTPTATAFPRYRKLANDR